MKTPATFPRAPLYRPDVLSDIRAQYRIEQSELKHIGADLVLKAGAVIENGAIVTGENGQYEFNCPHFGAGDFTVEAKVTFLEWDDSEVVPGSGNTGATLLHHIQGRWSFRVNHTANGSKLIFNQVTSGTGSWTPQNAQVPDLQLNREYHCVAERIGQVLSLYVDGVLYSQRTDSGPIDPPSDTLVISNHQSGAFKSVRRIRDIRIAARPLYYGAIYDNFKDDTGEVPPVASFIEGPTQQYTFKDNSLADEVSGVPATLGSATNMSDNRVITASNYSSRINLLPFYVKSGEDFVIELKVRVSSIGSAGAMLLGSWVAGNTIGNSWNLFMRTNRTLGMNIAQSLATTQTYVLSTIKTLNLNQDHHVVVTRASGVVKIYIDGEESANGEYNGPILRRTELTTTSWVDANGWLSGQRWDIRLARGRSDFVTGALPLFERPQYQVNLRQSILAQYDFATSVVDSVSGASASIASASLTRGRLVLTNSGSSRFEITVPDFGAGDFTVEFSINAGNIAGANELPLLAQWYSNAATHAENKFAIYSKTNGQIAVQIARSPTAGDFASGISAEGVFTLGEDHHVILQRHNGVVNLYVDGVSVVTFEFTGPLHAIGEYTLRSFYGQAPSYSYGARELWNLRVASRALYTGDVPKYPLFPIFPKPLPLSVVFYSKFEGDAGTSEIVDVVGSAVAHTSSIQLSSTKKAYGTTSLQGSGGYLIVPDSPRLRLTGDFTIEGFICVPSNGNRMLLGKGASNIVQWYNNKLYVAGDNGQYVFVSSKLPAHEDTFLHFAIVKFGTQWTLFINGNPDVTATSSDTFGNTSSDLWIMNGQRAASLPFYGFLDEFSISDQAKYQGAFTPKLPLY